MTSHTSIIVLPPRATVEESFEVLECCRRIETERDAHVLDAGRCERFGPLGVVLLAMSLEQRHRAGHSRLQFIRPKTEDADHFLTEIAFERFIDPSGHPKGPPPRGTLETRQLFALNPLYTEEVSDLLLERVPGTSDDARDLVQLCLNELLQNAFEHAESRVGAFVQCRWHAKDRNVRVAVADAGIGIPAALRRRTVQDLQRASDADVIRAAVTQLGLTSRQGGRPGGLGLKHLHAIATERGGRLTVISHGAKVVFKATGAVSRRTPHFRGSAIEIDFRPQTRVSRRIEEVL